MGGKRIRVIALRRRALPLCLTLVSVVAVAIVVAGAVPRRHLVRAMSVSGIEPSEGPIAGGTAVTIRGEAFPASGVDVRFGDAPATAVAVVSSREIRATTPPHPNGYAGVTVQANGQSAVSEFLFIPPTLESIRPGDITTVAGIGIYLAEGRAARAAPINVTGDVALDSHGNILIAEHDANVIRLIDSTGIIRRFAGTGLLTPRQADDIGDGGAATQALLNWPTGLAVGPAGDVYVAEQFNHRVRKIDRFSGVITTIAGSGPVGLTGGAVAGDGGPATAARLNEPNQVAFDARGNLYVLDAANTRIRKISPDGIITTVAGTGERGFSGDGGPATQARFDVGGNGDSGSLESDRDGNLFLVDDANWRVRRIDAATGIITTVAGGGTQDEDGVPATSASLSQPFGIALDGEGSLYVTDYMRIRVIDPSGIIATVYGGLTVGISPDGTPRETGMLMRPARMTYDPVGNRPLFFEQGTTRLRTVDLGTGVLTTVAGIGPSTLGENGRAIAADFDAIRCNLAVDSRGNLLLKGDGRLRRLEADGALRTIAGGGVFSHTKPPAERPALGHAISISGIAVAPNDDIYVTEAKAVARITAGGTYQRIAGGGDDYGYGGDGGPASLAVFDNTWGIAIDPEGNLFVNDAWNHCIRRIDVRTGIITRFAGRVPPHPPNTWVENRSSGDGGPALDADFLGPEFIATDQAGNVYASDFTKVRMIDRQGIINTGLDKEQFNCWPAALANDPARRVYVHCYCGKILRIDGPNVATPVVGTGPCEAGFAGDGGPAELALTRGISGMAIDARGNVYLNDGENKRIRAIKEVVK